MKIWKKIIHKRVHETFNTKYKCSENKLINVKVQNSSSMKKFINVQTKESIFSHTVLNHQETKCTCAKINPVVQIELVQKIGKFSTQCPPPSKEIGYSTQKMLLKKLDSILNPIVISWNRADQHSDDLTWISTCHQLGSISRITPILLHAHHRRKRGRCHTA